MLNLLSASRRSHLPAGPKAERSPLVNRTDLKVYKTLHSYQGLLKDSEQVTQNYLAGVESYQELLTNLQ